MGTTYKDEAIGPFKGRQCKAKCKATQERCKNNAVNGMEVCKVHGGLSKVGAEHPGFVHGRKSKYGKILPKKIAQVYEEMLNRDDALALFDEIALVDAKVAQFIEEGSMSITSWRQLRKLWNQHIEGLKSQTVKLGPEFIELSSAIEDGIEESRSWLSVMEALELRRKLVDTERKRSFEESRAIPIEHMISLLARVTEIIKTEISDPAIHVKIGRKVRMIIEGFE